MTPHSRGHGGRPPHKVLQLCSQVHDALAYALGETTDPVLLDLVLETVEPMPDDSHLLVAFSDPSGHGVVAAIQALDQARGFLRSAVAEVVQRARVPQLSFTLVPGGTA